MNTLDDPRHERYLQWLTTVRADRHPKTKTALADEFGVHVRTLRDWESKPEFVKEHEKRVRAIVGSPERTKAVLDALHETAVDREHKGHVAAAKEYLSAVGYISPHPKNLASVTGGETAGLSNQELEDLIDAKITELAQARGPRLAAVNGELVED